MHDAVSLDQAATVRGQAALPAIDVGRTRKPDLLPASGDLEVRLREPQIVLRDSLERIGAQQVEKGRGGVEGHIESRRLPLDFLERLKSLADLQIGQCVLGIQQLREAEPADEGPFGLGAEARSRPVGVDPQTESSGVDPWLGYAAHGVSKAGLIHLTKAAAEAAKVALKLLR